MILYVIYFVGGVVFQFIYNKTLNKIQCLLLERTVKMIKYTNEWHIANDPFFKVIIDYAEWIIL